ncbi:MULTISPECIES: hypothetical protein [unclassified Nocardia]|uniref:hypothetical protein n=1 Tax=unclassified Nocardia TaxID=2637762 RepID=UPI001CE49CFB|nr:MULTISPECIES: hypothetical protein [unclassified Nocardia]
MALLKADIDQLNKLASVLTDAGQAMGRIQVRSGVTDIQSALPGCKIGDTCDQAGESAEYAWRKVGDRFSSISRAVTTAAVDLASTDETFAQQMDTFTFRVKDR